MFGVVVCLFCLFAAVVVVFFNVSGNSASAIKVILDPLLSRRNAIVHIR